MFGVCSVVLETLSAVRPVLTGACLPLKRGSALNCLKTSLQLMHEMLAAIFGAFFVQMLTQAGDL